MNQDADIDRAAQAAVLAAAMMAQEQTDELLGPAQSSRLVRSGQLLRLDGAGGGLYPAFQFDLARRRVRPVVAKINVLLDATSDPWGVASWWLSISGSLAEGRSPSDVAASEDAGDLALLIRMAKDLVEP